MSSAAAALPYQIEVNGVGVRYDVRGSGERTLVLVHGHQAHHMWWHAVVALLAPHWRLVLLDLSGHGDSGHRADGYHDAIWCDDVLAVVAAVGGEAPVLVGHSMGGRIALVAAARQPDLVAGVVMVDSVVRVEGAGPNLAWEPHRPARTLGTFDEAVSRFRVKPEQPVPAQLLAPVASYSLRQVEDGWTWKHDQRGLPAMSHDLVAEAFASIRVPVRFVRAELSSVTEGVDDALRVLDPAGAVQIHIAPGSHHHVVIEDPDLCAGLVDRLASEILAPRASISAS